MSATIEVPFAEGQEVWWVGNESEKIRLQCPECLGTKIIRMVQATGQEFELACAYCAPGFDEPRGYISKWRWGFTPTPRTLGPLTSVDSYGANGETRYRYGPLSSEDIFPTEAECLAACESRNAERVKQQEEQALANLASKRRDLTWSVHYWQGQRARLRKDLERIEIRLGECKKRSKKKGE